MRDQAAGVAEAQINAVLKAGPDPVAAGNAGVLEVLVETNEPAAGHKVPRDADGTRAGEGADLDRPLRADERRRAD